MNTADQTVWRIVITGGPGAGKSSAIERLKTVFTEQGYRVLVIAETATELIQGGLCPWNCPSILSFQSRLFSLQRQKEDLFFQAPADTPEQRCLIILDRGLMDGKAYLKEEEFEEILDRNQLSEQEICSRYDAVFHLVSAAVGAGSSYTTDNNMARSETPEQAAQVEQQTAQVWTAHPRRTVIEATPCFEEKLDLLIQSVEHLLQQDPSDQKQ